jgi:hypothetical protein
LEENVDTLKAIRTTKYGIELEPKENGEKNYRNTSNPVKKFLDGKLPAIIEIQEVSSKGEITKVRVIEGLSNFVKSEKSDWKTEVRESKSADMVLSYAKDLVVAGKAETLDGAVRALIEARKILIEEL